MRDIPVGNGRFLVNFDDKYQLRDVYFPHVGEENHSEGFPFRFGVWVDGVFSWIFEDDWVRTIGYLPESAVTDVKLRNDPLGIEFECHDMVCSDGNIYLKHVLLKNTKGDSREVRVFFITIFASTRTRSETLHSTIRRAAASSITKSIGTF